MGSGIYSTIELRGVKPRVDFQTFQTYIEKEEADPTVPSVPRVTSPHTVVEGFQVRSQQLITEASGANGVMPKWLPTTSVTKE